jgi:hypothetical protein
LKISIIKESPQFGWVWKLQKTVRFQAVRGGYILFIFSKHVWEPQRYIITRYLIILITMNIILDTRLDPQPTLLQFLILGPLPYKYITPSQNRLTRDPKPSNTQTKGQKLRDKRIDRQTKTLG